MNAWVRRRVLDAVLRLGVPPFTWGYALAYRLACAFVVRSIRRQPGVVAIYLTGSLAAGGARYGLSDIDVKVFLEGRRDAQVFQAVRARFLRLRRVFPMLGPPDEKGIYFLDDLGSERRAYPLVALLLDGRFYRHRLLWGRDCLAEDPIPALSREDLREALPWRLKEWNEKFLLLLDAPGFAPPQRRYLLWKALADVGNFRYLDRAPEGASGLPREEAISFLAGQVPGVLRRGVEAAETERRRKFLVDVLDDGQRFDVWRETARWAVGFPDAQAGARATGPARRVSARATTWSTASDPALPTLQRLAPADARCALIDDFFVPASPLDCEGVGSFVRVLQLSRPVHAAEYFRLKHAFRSGTLGRQPIFVVERGSFGHCLSSPMLDHYLVSAGSEDGLLTFVTAATEGGASWPGRAVDGTRRRLARLVDQLRGVLADAGSPRLGRERLLRVFFSNLRALYLASEIDSTGPGDEVCLPGGPSALIELLAERGLRAPAAAFLAGAASALRGGPEPVSWPALRHVLLQGIDVAVGRRAWRDVQPAAEAALAISVVVVTRNRADRLERCLASLAHQTRRPDQLVVVDNGSTDDTPGVVRRLQFPCPVRFVFEPREGVGLARVAGCSAATGDVLAFIDDDAVADEGWLTALEQAFVLDPHVGAVGGRIVALADGRTDWISRALCRAVEPTSC